LKPRDIKPANIKLTPKGQIILLDFGLAKGGVTRQTLVGLSLYGYTPGYAPPEQIEGQPTDERSDLYGLGATLYALLTAQAPDDPISRRKYMERGLPDLLLPANQVNPQVPPHVAQALQRAMALEPAQRPASAAQMRALLNAPFNDLTVPPPSSTGPPRQSPLPMQTRHPAQPASFSGVDTDNPKRHPKRLPLLLGITMATVLLFVVLISAYVVRNGGSKPTIVVESEESTPSHDGCSKRHRAYYRTINCYSQAQCWNRPFCHLGTCRHRYRAER